MGWVVKNTPVSKKTGYYYEGREIALHKTSGEKQKPARYKNDWYPESAKLECATLWAVTRDIQKVSDIAKVPKWQIKKWMQEAWFDNIVRNVVKEKNELLDAKLTEVIGLAVDVIKDRLESGEVHVDRKTKEEYRVPVNVKSASIALETTFKERQLIRGEATSRTESSTADEKLLKLKAQFESLARSKGINPENKPIEGVEYEPVQGTGEGEASGSEPEYQAEESSEDSPIDQNQGEEVVV